MKFLKRFLLFISAIFALIVVFSCTNKKSEGNASVEDVIIYEGYSWNFLDPSAGTAGWEAVPNEFWAYSGTAVLSRDDSTFGRGMLRFDVDFTADSHRDWSEPKLRYTFSEPFSLEGIVRFTFDFYYNPYYASGGHFRSKIIALDDNVTVLDSVSSGISGEEEVGDFVKATVSLRIRNTGRSMDGMLLSIAGYMTDYKGPVFFDNLRWEPENYVPVVEPFNFVMPKLPAPEPMPNKIRLMNYLTDVYGKSIISGQMDTSWTTNDVMDMIDRVFTDTGKYPAIKGFDLIQLSENYPPFFGGREQIDEAIEWWEGKNNGVRLLPNNPGIHGIVTFCWHWRVGVEKEFYTDRTAFRIPWKDGKLDFENPDFKSIVDDLDRVAARLNTLKERDIPVLWRPLHEAAGNWRKYGNTGNSGAWFWWGASGPEPYIALWEFMYEYLTNVKQLNNLIWVWNGENALWYPNPNTVDIVGADLYPGDHGSQIASFQNTLEMVPERNRMVALTENGRIPDPDECIKDEAMWLWFMTWNDRSGSFQGETHQDNFWAGEHTNPLAHKRKVYNHPNVITLDKLPNLTTYRLR